MLNIFSWASWPSVCLLWRNVCLDFCSFFEWAVCFNGVKPYMCAKLLQSCPTVCDPMDCSPPGSSVHGKKTRVVCHALLQGIFPTQGLNLCLVCLLHWEEALWVVCKFWKLILCWSHQQICKYFLPNCEMSFCFVYFASFAVQELLRVSRSHLFIFVFTSIILGDR